MMEKIRELVLLLETGIASYDEQLKALQAERLKYIRLQMTDGFGTDEGESKDSWLLHLKQLEDSLEIRLKSLKQAIQDSAASFQQSETENSK